MVYRSIRRPQNLSSDLSILGNYSLDKVRWRSTGRYNANEVEQLSFLKPWKLGSTLAFS